MTRSGYCARLISRFRPAMPVLALTMQKKIYHQMAFFWGVIPHYFDTDQVEEAIEEAQNVIAEQKLSKPSGHITGNKPLQTGDIKTGKRTREGKDVKRKCSRCKQHGHQKNTCPNYLDSDRKFKESFDASAYNTLRDNAYSDKQQTLLMSEQHKDGLCLGNTCGCQPVRVLATMSSNFPVDPNPALLIKADS